MTLTEKSTGTLELTQVLELLAAEAVSEGAKTLARDLKPETDRFVVKDALAETTYPAAMAPRIYVCGPTPFVEQIARWLVELRERHAF